MPPVLWKGRVSLPVKIMTDMNAILSFITGQSRDLEAMKMRVKMGFEKECAKDLERYDELAGDHYQKIAQELLKNIDLKEKSVLDVGCGTGALSFLALEKGASRVTAADFSMYMLSKLKNKAKENGRQDMIKTDQADALNLPYEENSFDAALSGMTLGMLPDQKRALVEMKKAVRKDGIVAVSTHGPDYYHQAVDLSFRALPLRNLPSFMAYRPEFWPLTEKEAGALMKNAGLSAISVKRMIWTDTFPNGAELFDFYAATSGLWSFSRLHKNHRQKAASQMREYFKRKAPKKITCDVILATGKKAGQEKKSV